MTQTLEPLPRNLTERSARPHPLSPVIVSLIQQMHRDNLLYQGRGFCAAMSDLLINLLARRGIQSHAVEVTLSLYRQDPPLMVNVGFGHSAVGGPEIGTHVVVIVEHEQPLLVDLSIGHWLEPDADYVMAMANAQESVTLPLLRVDTDNCTVVYHERSDRVSPATIDLGIRNRIKWDRAIARQIRWNQILAAITVLMLVSSVAVLYHRSTENRHLIQESAKVDQKLEAGLAQLAEQRRQNRDMIDQHGRVLQQLQQQVEELRKQQQPRNQLEKK